MSLREYNATMHRLAMRHRDKFVAPKATTMQQHYFGEDIRVEVVSPCGYRRRGTISCTTGWQPSLMLLHRRGSHGSWDLLDDKDVIVAVIGKRGYKYELDHDKLQVAVYTGEAK